MRISDWSSDVCSSDLAKSVGIATVVWSYPRGGNLSKEGELALDVGAYAAHIAALIGAHIIKVKLPTAHIEQKDAQKSYEGTDWSKQSDRVKHVVQSCFNGRRLVVFSGGAARSEEHTSELQSLMRNSNSVICLKKKNDNTLTDTR